MKRRTTGRRDHCLVGKITMRILLRSGGRRRVVHIFARQGYAVQPAAQARTAPGRQSRGSNCSRRLRRTARRPRAFAATPWSFRPPSATGDRPSLRRAAGLSPVVADPAVGPVSSCKASAPRRVRCTPTCARGRRNRRRATAASNTSSFAWTRVVRTGPLAAPPLRPPVGGRRYRTAGRPRAARSPGEPGRRNCEGRAHPRRARHDLRRSRTRHLPAARLGPAGNRDVRITRGEGVVHRWPPRASACSAPSPCVASALARRLHVQSRSLLPHALHPSATCFCRNTLSRLRAPPRTESTLN